MYIYETHLHTYESSACGSTKASEYPAYYKSIGYSGIFITDHFFNGNCRIPPMSVQPTRFLIGLFAEAMK